MFVKRMVITLILVFIVFNEGLTALAMNTGLETESMISEEKESLWSRIHLELSDYKEENNKISCFDISEIGLVAIGFEYPFENKKVINIYNSGGKFLYGYSFECHGTYGVEWNGENLLICITRGDFAILVDKMGSCLDIRRIPYTPNNNDYWNDRILNKRRVVTVDRCEYRLVKGYNSYTKLVKTDTDGKVTTIYQTDTDIYMNKGDILWLLCFSWGIIGGVSYFIIKDKKKKRGVYEDTGFNPYESSDKT